MRFFSDDRLLRRATGLVILFGLAGLGARHWRDDMIRDGNYSTGNYNLANNLLTVTWWIAIVALLYIATCLIVSPSHRNAVEDRVDWYE